jgi:glycerol-3-phosphate dehydrogenase
VQTVFDILVIGGGINGAGIARDAAGRGLKVLLCEKNDLAGHTSSSSSKLIHGGLRYLETYEFRLVREALGERETLLKMAPHIIWPLRFVLPVEKGLRPAWMLRAGLFLYDHLARRSLLKGTVSLDLRTSLQGAPLQDHLKRGFEYSDCWVDDARLVVLNAMDAANRGTIIKTRTECVALERHADHWRATLRGSDGVEEKIQAKCLVNAAGPWVEDILGQFGRKSNSRSVRLVKGSHIVTRRLFDGDHAYIFQSVDGRVIFAIPYETDYTLIGTTEAEWTADKDEIKISPEETDYLCKAVSKYFKVPITTDDIKWTYAGVRPLFDDKSASASVVTRDYVFDLDGSNDTLAPALSIFGGKITTYRKLAEQAVDKLAPYFSNLPVAWTAGIHLPGGDFAAENVDGLLVEKQRQYSWIPEAQLRRMVQAYGTRLTRVIGTATSLADLGHHFGAGLYEAEVQYLQDCEFAVTANDILWRRSKLGLRLSETEQLQLESWMQLRSAA